MNTDSLKTLPMHKLSLNPIDSLNNLEALSQ